jgi:energy-converting hydrogenase Eha subunit B
MMREPQRVPGVARKVVISMIVLLACILGRLFISELSVVPATVVGVHPMHRVIYWSTYVAVTTLLPGIAMWPVHRLCRTPRWEVTLGAMYITGVVYFYTSEVVVYGSFLPSWPDLLAYGRWSLLVAFIVALVARRWPRR